MAWQDPETVCNNLYSPSRQKQSTKYKRIKKYKTKPKTVDRQIYTMSIQRFAGLSYHRVGCIGSQLNGT